MCNIFVCLLHTGYSLKLFRHMGGGAVSLERGLGVKLKLWATLYRWFSIHYALVLDYFPKRRGRDQMLFIWTLKIS